MQLLCLTAMEPPAGEGVPGPKGPRGSGVTAGNGPPSEGPEQMAGDVYIDARTGDIYVKT